MHEDNPPLSIIVCTNDLSVARKYILSNEEQIKRLNIEVIIIDNTGNLKFTSIADAYNKGVEIAKSELLMFVHHDTVINDLTSLTNVISYCSSSQFGIVGSCGVSNNHMFYSDRNVTSNNPDLKFSNPMTADVVDDTLFFVRRSVLIREPFDSQTITGFHLCATEYCVRMHMINLPVILYPLDISHFNIQSHHITR